jgi:DNA-binding response OmpR family regulator
MAKKRKRISAEQAAFDERTRMINEHIERLRRRLEEKKTAEAKG